MEEFKNLVLCDYKDDRIWINVRASLTEGSLEFAGDDLGETVRGFWGDDDYEYWYSFGVPETMKLLELIRGTEDPQEALLREFSGTEGCRKLRELCEANGIRYEFFSYA